MFDSDTLLGITNAALTGIGERTIDTIGDVNDKLSVQADILLRQVILDVESVPSKPWKELYETQKLVLADDKNKCGEWYFNKPTNCLVAVELISGNGVCRFGFREEGRFIIARSSEVPAHDVYLKFVRKSFDPSEWSADLRGCVISLLSARMIGAVASDPMKALNLERAFWSGEFVRRTENRILSADAVEQYPRGEYPGVI